MFQKPLQFLFVCAMLFVSANAFAQKYAISGKVTDAENAQPLFSATVQALGTTDGALTDFDGNYTLELPNGSYKLVFSFIGMTETIKEVTIAGAPQTLDVALGGNKLLEEVKVVADIAKDRATPVAFSNISTIKLKEELAGQDIPMILNSTPGVYATQGGGGVGDARISIRGFSQRNVAVMLDGIPVNDMENGQVYWSNWFGLENNTKAMQVQRGLGASKLAVPSVGGSINILTKGIDDAKSITLSNELGSGNYIRSTLFVNSGRLKGGWGISSAVSFQKQDGIIDQLYSKGFFYYLRIDKQFKNHTLSLSGFGAPQEHGQNNRRVGIGFVDTTLANSLYSERYTKTYDTKTAYANVGRTYGQGWGRLANGDPLVALVNYYHKPQFSFRHSWQISPKVFLSNVAYLSIGNGGGVANEGNAISRTEDGNLLLDFPSAIAAGNQVNSINKLGRSNVYLRSSVNNHFWYGLLSTVKYDINKAFTFSGGLDLRDFKGDHYRTPYNLLGGNFVQADIPNAGKAQQVKIGDKYTYDNSAFIRWGGAFGLIEFKKDKWSGFFNASGAYTGYKVVDNFKPRILTVDGNVVTRTYTIQSSGITTTVTKPVYIAAYNGSTNPLVANDNNVFKSYTHNGETYTMDSPEAKIQAFDWRWIPSYTFKMGGSYNINKNHSVFANGGWLSRATRYNNIYLENRTNLYTPIKQLTNTKNEEIRSAEAGYSFRSPKFSANINGYYTSWQNKPIDNPPTENDANGDPVAKTIIGVGALHQGIEFDFAYNITKKITVEGLASYGDWRWQGIGFSISNLTGDSTSFDPTGVRVGDAAQMQFGAAIRYEPIKGLYFKTRATYFGNNYANFSPEFLTGNNVRKEAWKMPDYYLIDLNTGYTFNIDKKIKAGIRLNVLNVLDAIYISDAQSNDFPSQTNYYVGQIFKSSTPANYSTAETSSVLFGLPRRWNMAFTLEF
jgi:iron complex outermembrane recepter protein